MQQTEPPLTDRQAMRLVDRSMVLVVWICCLAYSFQLAPLPGVNEPHYLSMARSFVDSGWCVRDPFLQSHPVHWAFFTLIGWPTYWWGFETAAIFGRLLGYGVLAFGWVSLLQLLVPNRWGVLGVLLGMLFLMSLGNFSGEWLIGGIEGKVFSYGAVFASLAYLAVRDLPRGALWTGVAIAFHPVVGMWHLIAVAGTWGVLKLRTETSDEVPSVNLPSSRKRLFWGIAIVLGLVGFLPAAALLVQVPPDIAYQGTRIQVYRRLSHHLNPLVFPAVAYWCYGGLLAVYVILMQFVPKRRVWRFCGTYVGWCVVFAVSGIIVGYFPHWFPGSSLDRLSPRLLKFYPFRMADLLLPWFVVLGLWVLLTDRFRNHQNRLVQICLSILLLCGCGIWIVSHPVSAKPANMSAKEAGDWIAACHWVRRETSQDALFLTTRRGWGFKWYAERAEFFSHKDAPQDAAGLIAWEGRQRLLWELFAEKFSLEKLKEFRKKTRTDYVLITLGTPCDLKPIYENQNFAIYDLRQLDELVAIDE